MKVELWGHKVNVQLDKVGEYQGDNFGVVTIRMSNSLHERVAQRDETNEEEESYLLPHVQIIQPEQPPAPFVLESVSEDGAVYEARFIYKAGTRFSLMKGGDQLFTWKIDEVAK